MRLYLGLDPATICGVALYNPATGQALVYETKGTPIEQYLFIDQFLKGRRVKEVVIAMEKLHNFRNAVTTRSLLERYGYLKWTFIADGFGVEEHSPNMVRNYLGFREKQDIFTFMTLHFRGSYFSSNHSDALAVALYSAGTVGDFDPKGEFPSITEGYVSLLQEPDVATLGNVSSNWEGYMPE